MNIITPSDPGILLLPTSRGMELIQVSTIIRIEAISNYSKLFFTDGKYLTVSKTLKCFEVLLAEKAFVRIHRSHLVNIYFIKKYKKNRCRKIILLNDEEIEISRRRKKSIVNRLSKSVAA